MSFSKTLAKRLADYNSSRSLGFRLRSRRIQPLLRLIEIVFQKHGHVNIIDVGGTATYWGIVPLRFLEAHKVKITIVNLPEAMLPMDFGPFAFDHSDGCNLSAYDNNSFHIAHSNSVIEHVGDWERMVQFSTELRRVAKNVFIQTPNYWFPVEPHCMTPFFHWLPEPVRVWLVIHFQLGHWEKATSVNQAVLAVESARLMNRKMFQELFQNAEIRTERLFLMPKSFIAILEEPRIA